MGFSPKEARDGARRLGIDEALRMAANIPDPEKRWRAMRMTAHAGEDMNDPTYENWSLANERYREKIQNYRKSRIESARRWVAGIAVGLVAIYGAIELSKYVAENRDNVAEASGEIIDEEIGRWVSMDDFRRAGHKNIRTVWQIVVLLGGDGHVQNRVKEIQKLNNISNEELGTMQPHELLLISNDGTFDQRLEELGFDLVEDQHEDGEIFFRAQAAEQ